MKIKYRGKDKGEIISLSSKTIAQTIYEVCIIYHNNFQSKNIARQTNI
jgi:hypothetical protein